MVCLAVAGFGGTIPAPASGQGALSIAVPAPEADANLSPLAAGFGLWLRNQLEDAGLSPVTGAAGSTEEQILLYFEASYGEFIRLEPKPTGFNLTVWIAPIVALLLGALVVAQRLRSKPSEPVAEAVADDDLAAYRDRVRQEISS